MIDDFEANRARMHREERIAARVFYGFVLLVVICFVAGITWLARN